MPVVLGTIRVRMIATDDDMVVRTEIDGDLQYITAVGMLDIAKHSLQDALKGEGSD